MAGVVYLRTNCFKVKLEGITFKAKDFETLCSTDFLFPAEKIWARPPVVGIDVMRHPRDPNNILMLLCFGVGCVILRFNSGDVLPESIFKFLTDERIRLVGFGIPEKEDLFPFEELGLTKNKVDIGYLAAKILDDQKYKKYELADLARKVLRVKQMIGLTESSSFERHEQIKCAICQLFITTAIAMALIGKRDGKKSDDTPKKGTSFLKNLNHLPLFTEGWFKFPKSKKIHAEKCHDIPVETALVEGFTWDDDIFDDLEVGVDDGSFVGEPFHGKSIDVPYGGEDDDNGDEDYQRFYAKGFKGFLGDAFNFHKGQDGASPPADNNPSREACCPGSKQPLKGILKCPSTKGLSECPDLSTLRPVSITDSTASSSSEEIFVIKKTLRRANSKGFNVSFK